MSKKTEGHLQFAALPYRIGKSGRPEVMLLTSRETHRWVIPKGWPVKGMKPREVAAREALEEAGLIGSVVGRGPVGTFHYEKRLPRERLLCEVQVFLLRVDRQMKNWPEKGQREIRWFDPVEAAALVDEGGLGEIVREVFSPD